MKRNVCLWTQWLHEGADDPWTYTAMYISHGW